MTDNDEFNGYEVVENLPVGDRRDQFPNNLVEVTVVCPECRGANREAKRGCGTCDGEGSVKKIVPREALDAKEDLNCDTWGQVDFGDGPVEIRCTRMGEHDEHACVVIFEGEPVDPSMN